MPLFRAAVILLLGSCACCNGEELQNFLLRCVSVLKNEDLWNESSPDFLYVKGAWSTDRFCDQDISTVFIAGGNDTHGQKQVIAMLDKCKQRPPEPYVDFKWVQPVYLADKEKWYLFKTGSVFYGFAWDIGPKRVYNDIWDEAGGGFTKSSWERQNCRYLFDAKELDFETSIDAL